MTSLEARALAEFDAFAELDGAHRAQALALLRATDPELYQAVDALLRADALEGALEASPLSVLARDRPGLRETQAPDPRLGRLLGPWRLDAVLAHGGMGTVYRAHRDDGQYAQAVAVKCVRTEISSPALALAIRNERDALARLDHPNIATLIDGGIDPGGFPWLAMRLVEGLPIDRYCDLHRLDLRARAALFDQVCDAVAYAHSRITLHSDIKPANVLVGEDGRPMLLDFGLSSLSLGEGAAAPAKVALTWGYAAPEVLAGGDYSVASDVYALGAVLYLLLCGRWPPAQAAMHAGLSLPTPELPSRLALAAGDEAAAMHGCASAQAWSRALAGDLDRIARTCTDPDPGQRYRSANELQDELRRWLQLRPLRAREGEGGYRLRLFLRRNRRPAWVAGALALALGAATGLALQHARQAEREAAAAREVQRLFEDTLGEMTLSSLGHSPLVSREMLRVAERRLRERGGDPPAVRARGFLALAKSLTTLGDYAQALRLVEEARALGLDDPAQRGLAQAALAHLLNQQSHYAQAERAVEEGQRSAGAGVLAAQPHIRLSLEVERARAQWGQARLADANATLGRALADAERLAARDPVPLAELLIQRGEWRTLLFQFEDARSDLARALALTDGRHRLVADSARAELEHTLFAMDERKQALAVAQALLASRRRLLGEDHPETGKAWAVMSEAQYANSQLGPALEAAQNAERILSRALGPDHPEVADALRMAAAAHSQTGEASLGVQQTRRALAIMLRAHGPSHQRSIRAMVHLGSAIAVQALESGAEPPWHEVVDLYQRAVSEGEKQGLPMLVNRVYLIRAKLRLGQTEGAEAELDRVIDGLTRARGPANDRVLQTRYVRVELLLRQRREDDAEQAMLALLRDTQAPGGNLTSEVVRFNCYDKLGDIASARRQGALAAERWRNAYELGLRIASAKEAAVYAVGVKLARLDPQAQRALAQAAAEGKEAAAAPAAQGPDGRPKS